MTIDKRVKRRAEERAGYLRVWSESRFCAQEDMEQYLAGELDYESVLESRKMRDDAGASWGQKWRTHYNQEISR